MDKLQIVGVDKEKSFSDGKFASTRFLLSDRPTREWGENFEDNWHKYGNARQVVITGAELDSSARALTVQSPGSVPMEQVLNRLNEIFDKINAAEDDYNRQLDKLKFRTA